MKYAIYLRIKHFKVMDTLITAGNEFEQAKKIRKEAIINSFDGRTQQFVAEKSGIDPFKLNRWINGLGGLEEKEIESLATYLGVDFK